MFGIYLCFVILNICQGFLVPDGLTTVSSPAGDIVGFTSMLSMFSKQYRVRQFWGIPYAEPPTGQRRFAKPVPKARFATQFDATEEGPACYQIETIFRMPPGKIYSEDCLVLNIFAPENAIGDDGNAHPVMIFIHGGGFILGMSNLYNGNYLSASGNVIVVTINYRLVHMGFLSTGDAAAPGNFGLWDQHLAIKWVHDNIQAFGGDPSRVTIFGESSGSASVVFQMLYPGNKGLFQRAIAQSGSVTSPWAFKKATEAQDIARQFSNLIGCRQLLAIDMVECLRSKSAKEMNETMNDAPLSLTQSSAVIDNDFVLDDPKTILSGRSNATEALDMFNSVDFIIGVNSKEGLLDVGLWVSFLNIKDFHGIPRNGFEEVLIPFYLSYYFKQDIPEVVKQVAIFEYTEWSDPNDDIKRTENLVELVSAAYFYVPAVQTANLHSARSQNTSTYVYKFSTQPPDHFVAIPDFMDGPGVASNADEIFFVFGAVCNRTAFGDAATERVIQTVMTAWTNFAKTGNPNTPNDINTAWPQYGTAENYLEITPDMTSQPVKQGLAPKAFAFWQHLVPEILQLFSVPKADEPDGVFIG